MKQREELREQLRQRMLEKLAAGDKSKVRAEDLNQDEDAKEKLKENS
jgi:hypothetical protein